MPVFIILLFLGAALLWLLLSFIFIPLGGLAKRLIDDAKRAITEDENEKES